MRHLASATIFLPLVALAVPTAAAESCTGATAREATIAAIAETPQYGECVTVTGVAWQGRLYTDIAAIYRTRRGDEGNRIGFRPLRRASAEKPGSATDVEQAFEAERQNRFSRQPRRVTVTGKIGRGRIGMTAGGPPPDAIFYAGIDRLPTVIFEREIEVSPEKLTRLTAAEAPAELVSLSPLAADSVWMPRFAAAADAIEAALRSRDPEQWAPLFGGKWLSDYERGQIGAMLSDPDNPFLAALGPEGPAKRVIFGWLRETPSAAQRAAVEARQEAEALVCWSSHPQAAALWPIAAFDADNQPGRPYACARITYSVRDARPSWRAFIEQHDGGLPEPEHPPAA